MWTWLVKCWRVQHIVCRTFGFQIINACARCSQSGKVTSRIYVFHSLLSSYSLSLPNDNTRAIKNTGRRVCASFFHINASKCISHKLYVFHKHIVMEQSYLQTVKLVRQSVRYSIFNICSLLIYSLRSYVFNLPPSCIQNIMHLVAQCIAAKLYVILLE